MKFTLEIASPVYPKTTATGSVIAPGSSPTKVVRVKTADFTFDVDHAALVSGKVSGLGHVALETGLSVSALRKQLVSFARAGGAS